MSSDFRKKQIDIKMGNKEKENDTKQNPYIRLLKLIIWIIVLGLIFSFFYYKNFKTKILIPNDTIVQIKKEDNLANLGKKINELDNIFYKIYIKNNQKDFQLKVGTFKIKGNSNIDGIFEGLKTPLTNDINITILEGWNIYDIDKCLSNPEYFAYTRDGKEYTCMFKTEGGERIYLKDSIIKEGEYIEYVTNQEKINALSEFYPFINGQITFEGFLYPDTYRVDASNFLINQFVIKQLDTFEKKVYEPLLSLFDVKTINEIINLASIVEKEERNPKEKATVAGILKKRLNNNWMIGADITVCYPHKLTSEECKMVVSKYINEKSEYNTRTMTGLPKTPIGNPSYETINATINDNKTDYWFYLHNVSTGKIYYAKTNAEHEANKKFMY